MSSTTTEEGAATVAPPRQGKVALRRALRTAIDVAAITPATPQTPATIAPGTFTPTQIVATGPAQAIVAVIAAGALTFATFAYLDSRKAVKKDK